MTAEQEARAALARARDAHREATRSLAQRIAVGGSIEPEAIEANQLVAYELALSAAELAAADEALAFARSNPGVVEVALGTLFTAEVVRDVGARLRARAGGLGLTGEIRARTIDSPEATSFVESNTAPSAYERAMTELLRLPAAPSRGLTGEQASIAETFRRFSTEIVEPLAGRIHRQDLLVPHEIFDGLRDLGCFGLSIPARYGGAQDDDRPDNMGMVIVTEELSRGSLAAAGSLITRPEILARALLKGGTPAQKERWLPALASGAAIAAVAVTEPDFGSDVAGMKLSAVRDPGRGWRLSGVKTWCTFAGFANVLMVLARTDPRPESRHRGLSLFLAEKPQFDGHDFAYERPDGGGRIEGRAIGTIGYRGMHSYEVAFEGYLVPDENLVGGEDGLGKGFYLQMEGFSGGRLQTAARALGVMQAAYDASLAYASERRVFGRLEREFGLTQYKLARMAALIHAARQLTYHTARLCDQGRGQTEASMVKLFCCKIAEWVTREAMQIHGGMGYAEEFSVSRYFLDARVLSIFEGAEEVLALRVVARSMLTEALT